VGAFYYALAWPLASKAAVLAAAGLALAALAAWAGARLPLRHPPAAPPAPYRRRARWGVAATAFAALAVVNVGIWQKETLIRQGRPIFVPLAPADPRSLMQGDYMRLAFQLPQLPWDTLDTIIKQRRPHVVARVDERGVATLLRLDEGQPLGAQEIKIELTPRDGRWTLVTDAWFFREGQAARWQPAEFGEFRVDASGRALLVGLRGPQLKPL
jgi:uncharacterized membrane-anchored protein